MTYSRETGRLWWIGFQTCNFERSIAIWLHSFLNILIFSIFFCYNIVLAPFKLALKVSKLTISFVSSLKLVRQVQTFLPKREISSRTTTIHQNTKKYHLQNKNANISCLAAMILKHFSPKKCQICKPIASAVQTSAQGGASLLVATKCRFRLLTVRGIVAKL